MSFDVSELKFTKEHEWIKIDGNHAIVGISDYAAEQLGDVVHVDLPEIHGHYPRASAFATLESVKSVSDAYLPISGKILEVNSQLKDDPGKINADPYGAGWLVKIEIKNPSEVSALMDHNGYQSFLSEEA